MRLVRLLLVVLSALLAVPAPLAGLLIPAAFAQEDPKPDYAAWEKDAARAEEVIASARASNAALEEMRVRIVDWRARFDVARATNAPQIETAKAQMAELGAPPADGAAEDAGIAQRRRELGETLARLQAPGVEAGAAFTRAEGIIRQTDALIRDRLAKELLRLMPSPANPLHWPSGLAVLTQGLRTLWAEIDSSWNNPVRRAELRNSAPLTVLSVVLAVLLMWRGPGFMERLSIRLQTRASMRARNVVAALVSLGQVVVPVIGMLLLTVGFKATGIPGPRLEALVSALPGAAFAFFFARWLGSWLFPDDARVTGPRLIERTGEARFHTTFIGLLSAAEVLRAAFTTEVRPPLSQAAQAVWLAPLVCGVAIFVFRLGLLLRRHAVGDAEHAGEAVLFRNRMVSLFGTAMVGVSLLAPPLALIGYVTAANALIWPLVDSLALIGLIILLQRFLTDIYLIVTKAGEDGREALIPVLTGFLLAIAALPIFALIWGARTADLSEAWTRFQIGANLGGVRISPMAIITLFVVFAIGYMITRLVQGAMRSSVLPRTKLDKGAQTAVVSGVGYLGLFLAGLAAVTTAGIDLSALAIVAGALSVGIGFGLQNIVQNFIAGIILLVERPISEGDTIEVGNRSGTVKAISVRSTRIVTGDQSEVIVPNAEFISSMVTNLTRDNLRGRLVVPVTVAFDTDTRLVDRILREIIEAQPLVLFDPEPSVLLVGFGQFGINFEIRAILSDLNFKPNVQSDVNHEIAARFRAAGIVIPYTASDPIIWQMVGEKIADVPPMVVSGQDQAGRDVALSQGRKGKPTVDLSAIHNDPRSDPDEREDDRDSASGKIR